MKRSATCLLAGAALSGCMTAMGPEDQAKAAAELGVVVERGCMAYALGEKPLETAMADAGLARNRFTFSWPSPGVSEPQFMSSAPGRPIITVYGAGCTVYIKGSAAAFDGALDAIYARRFGAGFGAHPVAQPLDQRFPGMRRYCIAGHVFQSYPDPADGILKGGFNVMVAPGGTVCVHDGAT